MAMILGPRALQDLAVPAGWDANFLKLNELKDGTTYEAVVSKLVAAIAAFNTALTQHAWMPALTFKTTKNTLRYRIGGNVGAWRQHTEFSMPDAGRTVGEGHMIPKSKFDAALGWTWDWLNEAIMEDVDADIASFLMGALDMYEVGSLTRFFKKEAETVGDTGVSPGFVGGDDSLNYVPPRHEGKDFDASHSHYLRIAVDGHATAAAQMTAHLKEHGHMPPYELWVSEDDKTAWAGVDDDTNKVWFRQLQQPGIQYSTLQDLAAQGLNEIYIGVIETPSGVARVRPMNRVPTGYCSMYRPAGVNVQGNPLRWLYNDRFGAGVVPLSGDKLGWPVQKIIGYAEHGFGVGADRTVAVLCQLAASGDYTTPTITQ